MHNKVWKRIGVLGAVVGLTISMTSASEAVLPSLPSGTVVTCTQISGSIQLNPGVGLTGTSSGVKWQINAVANNCSTPPSSAGTVAFAIAGAVVKGSGYFIGGNTCTAATVASNWGAMNMKVNWISVPAVAPTIYSPVATGAFLAGTTLDATGLTHNRNHVGVTPVNLIFGGDWIASSFAQLAIDCAGAAPNSRLLKFQTPAPLSPHNPPFIATI